MVKFDDLRLVQLILLGFLLQGTTPSITFLPLRNCFTELRSLGLYFKVSSRCGHNKKL